MAKKSTAEVDVNMTPMIDIVFQLIIFFVVTIELDRQVFNENIHLAFAPHGPAIEKKDPRTIMVEVDRNGGVSIARRGMSINTLTAIMKQAVNQYGASTPVQIRGDKGVRHEKVREVMNACGKAGVWRVSFVATKEKAGG